LKNVDVKVILASAYTADLLIPFNFWPMTALNVIAHTFHAYNLIKNNVFAVLECWFIQHR